MAYNQPGGVLGDPVKTRANSKIATEDRPKGNGRSYSKMAEATQSTEGTIGGPESFRYKSDNKIYDYVPGEQNDNPKTGYRL